MNRISSSEQLLSRVSLLVAPLYPALAPRVASAILSLLDDALQEPLLKETTVFHFAALFRERPFRAFVENLAHDSQFSLFISISTLYRVMIIPLAAYMVSLLSSGDASSVVSMMDRLRVIPLAPPLDTLAAIAKLLATTDNATVIDCIG